MARYFYGRVSTEAQNLARQEEAANGLGIPEDNRYFDKISGAKREREGLDSLIAVLQEGDELYSLSLDRLSRSMTDLCSLMETFNGKGVSVHLLHENMTVNTSTPMGKLSFQLFACLAEFQRNCINQTCAEGRAAKIAAEGRCGGRKPVAESVKQNIWAMEARGCSVKEMMEVSGLARSTVYKVLKMR
ncbi:MAG: recombinase family protein [Eggerthellaceae bacterium]|jgi:DNA invertase Pin-like site-specific DNA recombinase|nr:recombinase family protein [Eggerthellaceae bacterium]